MSEWSVQRVEQLAPDAAAVKAAQGLAKVAKWQGLGRNESAVWGECQGSGAKPYQVRVDLTDVAYKCSCPSRKLPCKHCLGVLLLLASGSVSPGEPPAFVQEWLANRIKRTETKAAKAAAPPTPVDEAAQKKRADKREARVDSGIQLLEAALADLIAQGLAAARTQPVTFWSQLGSRLIDAQAPGLARRVIALGDILIGRHDWQSAALAEMARLQLLIDAYRNIARLPAELAAEIRNLIGWTQEQKELLSRPGVRDRWLVAGREQDEEANVRVQRTWLCGVDSNHKALLLEFAAGNQPLQASFTVGQCIDAELVFFDGSPPLRALMKEKFGAPAIANDLPHVIDVQTLQNEFAARLVGNPWLERWPVTIGPVVPAMTAHEQLLLVDATGRTAPLASSSRHASHLLSLSGGAPLSVFGTWDGRALLPMSVASQNQLYAVGVLTAPQLQLSILSKVA